MDILRNACAFQILVGEKNGFGLSRGTGGKVQGARIVKGKLDFQRDCRRLLRQVLKRFGKFQGFIACENIFLDLNLFPDILDCAR